jgi:hypothetical protein
VAQPVLLHRHLLMGADGHLAARFRGAQQDEAFALVDLVVAERSGGSKSPSTTRPAQLRHQPC